MSALLVGSGGWLVSDMFGVCVAGANSLDRDKVRDLVDRFRVEDLGSPCRRSLAVYRARQNCDVLAVASVAGCSYDRLTKLVCDDSCRDSEIRQHVCEHNCSRWPVCLGVAVASFESRVLSGGLAFLTARDKESGDQADADYIAVRREEVCRSYEFSAAGALTVRVDESSLGWIPPDDRLEF